MITIANNTQTPMKCIVNRNEQELYLKKIKKKTEKQKNRKQKPEIKVNKVGLKKKGYIKKKKDDNIYIFVFTSVDNVLKAFAARRTCRSEI